MPTPRSAETKTLRCSTGLQISSLSIRKAGGQPPGPKPASTVRPHLSQEAVTVAWPLAPSCPCQSSGSGFVLITQVSRLTAGKTRVVVATTVGLTPRPPHLSFPSQCWAWLQPHLSCCPHLTSCICALELAFLWVSLRGNSEDTRVAFPLTLVFPTKILCL